MLSKPCLSQPSKFFIWQMCGCVVRLTNASNHEYLSVQDKLVSVPAGIWCDRCAILLVQGPANVQGKLAMISVPVKESSFSASPCPAVEQHKLLSSP